jgi:acyl-coenzyme A synthetase/AMP-(fatty) acid ligase
MSAFFALLKGNHLVVMPRFDAGEALTLIEQYRVDWMYAVPTMMHRIWRLPEAERGRFDLSSLRVLFHVGAPCPPWLKQAWIEWLGADRVIEAYGGTEAQAITFISGQEWIAHRGSVGRTVIGEIRVLDGEGNELPPREVGEIWMRRGPTHRHRTATSAPSQSHGAVIGNRSATWENGRPPRRRRWRRRQPTLLTSSGASSCRGGGDWSRCNTVVVLGRSCSHASPRDKDRT